MTHSSEPRDRGIPETWSQPSWPFSSHLVFSVPEAFGAGSGRSTELSKASRYLRDLARRLIHGQSGCPAEFQHPFQTEGSIPVPSSPTLSLELILDVLAGSLPGQGSGLEDTGLALHRLTA